MEPAALALVAYVVLAVVVLIGVVLLVNGMRARRRSNGVMGTSLCIAGIVVVLLPAAFLIGAFLLRSADHA